MGSISLNPFCLLSQQSLLSLNPRLPAIIIEPSASASAASHFRGTESPLRNGAIDMRVHFQAGSGLGRALNSRETPRELGQRDAVRLGPLRAICEKIRSDRNAWLGSATRLRIFQILSYVTAPRPLTKHVPRVRCAINTTQLDRDRGTT